MILQAVIFDLDGVLTDTAEYHFLAWKRLADEAGVPFDRVANEHLRGVSRRESLRRILQDRPVDEADFQAMMNRKNDAYRQMLGQITPDNLLPGVLELLGQLDEAGIPFAVASASRNAAEVIDRLGISHRVAALVDGGSVRRQKPAPDIFRLAAARLCLSPARCLVVEDAAAGVIAGLDAGMRVLALGPAERFEVTELAGRHFATRPGLSDASLETLQKSYELDPAWHVVEPQFSPDKQHHHETIFTIGNGYFCSRGVLEEGYPNERRLTLAHGIFDDAPVVMTELANLPDWIDCRLWLDNQLFRLDMGEVLDYQRYLSLKSGSLHRAVRWRAPNGKLLDISFERLASYARPQSAAWRLLVTAVDQPCQVRLDTGIDGHVDNDGLLHWRLDGQGGREDDTVWLQAQTRASKERIAAAARVISSSPDMELCADCPGHPFITCRQELAPGETFQLDKIVGYAASRDAKASLEPVRERALSGTAGTDYDQLAAESGAAWQRVWQDIDVEIEGDLEAQLAIRFSLYQLQIAAPRDDQRVSIGAKTLSGLGYRGHVFWDTETFVLPFFTHTQPEVARNLLLYRYHTLPGARKKAAANGYAGAQYAWESAASGEEVTPTWVPDPTGGGKELVRIWTGDIEVHISADIAYAILQYWHATGDVEFMRRYGAEMILDSASFWGDRAEPEHENGVRQYAIRNVIGPDEYHDHVDNNIYTNRMAQWHLQAALDILDWLQEDHPEDAERLASALDLSPRRLAHWQDVINHIIIHHDSESGLLLQCDGFFDLEPVDWAKFEGRNESIQFLLGIEKTNESLVLKQPDAIMLLCLLRDHYDRKTWQATWDAYVPITDHSFGSSLGPSIHAWAACELDMPDTAYDYLMLAANADLHDVRGNAGDGIHAASAGGIWQAIVFGFAGLRLGGAEGVSFSPRLPSHWQRLAFNLSYQGVRQFVEIDADGNFTVYSRQKP